MTNAIARPAGRSDDGFWNGLAGTTLKLAGVFWVTLVTVDSVIWSVAGIDPVESLGGKIALNSGGALITVFITLALHRLRGLSLSGKVVLAFGLAMLASPFYAWIELALYRWHMRPQVIPFDYQHFGSTMNSASAMFLGWACLYIALVYSFDLRDREQKLAAAREEALGAQMQALHYQVNPHFLFNTLNSIAALIEEEAPARAGTMVLSLSNFLRTTLEIDPLHDVALEAELALQQDYLAIEQERFPDRMKVTIEADAAAREALVPSLILQPLVENAVKHGVGRSSRPVEIRIEARKAGERLLIAVENGVDADRGAAAGSGIGLGNVAARIATRFGEEGRFSAGLIDEATYRAEIELPWRSG